MDNYTEKLVKQIIKEAKALPKQDDYDLGTFTKEQTIKNTSSTLLTVVAKLTTNGKISRESLSIAQSIQAHITNTSNQTTLGLAVKLHHRFGSKEVISLLHEYGFLCTYGEVMRFNPYTDKSAYRRS